MPRSLTPALASRFAGLALAGVGREWPHAYQLLAHRPGDIRSPRKLHPAFFGCYDWHSSVHGHWTLARLLRLFPGLPSAARIRAALNRSLTAKNIAMELAYFEAPDRRSFERPYGWGWLLALAAELREGTDAEARCWSTALRPLESYVAESFCLFLPKLSYPVRSGVHSNTAFGLTLALDYARTAKHFRLERAILSRSAVFYGADADAPAAWEPSGEDFLSATLTEAYLMSRVLPRARFRRWLSRFLPGLGKGKPESLMTPPRVVDRSDGRLVHLDGLSLSRSWVLHMIADEMPDCRNVRLAAERHERAGLARVSSGDYAGEHWLASFAVYLLTRG